MLITGCAATIKYDAHEYKFVYDKVSWHEAKILAE